MQLVRTLITENNEKYEHFGYYEGIIDVIEQHAATQPDVCIEGCKSLIEGVSKSILKSLDATFNQEEVDGLNFQPLFKRALQKLAEHKEEIEIDFIHRAVALIQILGEIRNKRGDISHGKLAPKELFSYAQFSKLVMQMTEGIVFYVLEQFFSIDLSYKEEIKYEDNMEFNLWLDESNPMGNLSYSRALFDQDNVSYFEELLEYQTEQEEEITILEVEEIE
jgi:hypothetical protein